ncbi:MAG: hypothetical protein EA387_04580 [Nitriliruptor sp.]|nr:MAG: hypothetical protein EA387_04580 [Nitriliruptor sp.]
MPKDPWNDDRGDDGPDEPSSGGSPGGVPDDLSDLTPDDIPDDLSDLLGPASPEGDIGPAHPSRQDVEPSAAAAGGAAAGEGATGDQRSTSARLIERYIEVRAATMTRDGGPGLVLRWSARAPLLTTLVLAVLVGAVLAVTFGVPPVSPLFLIPVVCGPVYPWLRLESRAQAVWRSQQAD